jgi:hypothetical protein
MGVNAQTYGGRFRSLWSPEAFLGRKGLPRAGWPNSLPLGG